MFAADAKIEKAKAPLGSAYCGQGAVTVALAVVSLAALVWAFAVSLDQARSYDLRAGLEEVKTTGMGQ